MSLENNLIGLAQAIGADVKAQRLLSGDLSALAGQPQTSLVAAINELHTLLGANAGALAGLNTTAKSSLVAAINELRAGLGVVIDDGAGDGSTAVTWSADKIFDVVEAAKTAVKDELTNGASAALDTLAELATALGNDPNFAATLATEMNYHVRYDQAQYIDTAGQAQARTNIGAASAAAVGDTERDLVADYNAAKV